MIYLNLYDSQGNTLSNVAVDDAWWTANSVAATAYAASRGVGVYVYGELQAGDQVDQTISDMGTWDNWVATQYTSLRARPPAAPTSGAAVAAVVVGVPVALWGLYALFK
jgi:hypothetical protein